jgi:DUF917 family protein
MHPVKYIQLTAQDLQDILVGAALLGSGGGGPVGVGQQIIDALIAKGTLPTLLSPVDLPDTSFGAVSAFVGSPDSATGSFDWSPATKAFAAMSSMRVASGLPPLGFVLPGEVGAANTFIPMAVAASLTPSLPVVDCAGARRAIPGLGEDTYASNEVPISPIVLSDGVKHMTMNVPSPQVGDQVIRRIIASAGFGQLAGVAMWPMTGNTVRATAVLDTTTYARDLGAAIRTAPAGEKVAATTRFTGGWVMVRGTIMSIEEQTSGGFDLGVMTIAGSDGTSYRIFNQNENLIAWSSVSPAPLGLAPDLMGFMTDDGQTFSNADPLATKGTVVNVIAMPSMANMRVPYIVDQFLEQLRSIGYGGPYVPIEQLRR